MTRLLALAMAAMFGQHVVATIGRNVPPVVAPAILGDLGIPAAAFGLFVALLSFASVFFQLGCGGFMVRYGGLRMNQWSLLLLVMGLVVVLPVGIAGETLSLVLFVLAAVLLGGGGALSTPANSHVLGRFAPPRLAPLMFSLKQTGAPLGFMALGIAGPWLVGAFGWRGACLAFAALCAASILALQPFRARFDDDRNPAHPLSVSDFRDTLRAVAETREIRMLAFACFAFNGMQFCFTSFFVLHLVESLGYSLAEAGSTFSLAVAIAVPARIGWGWLGIVLPPRLVIGLLALAMAASGVLLGLSPPGWPGSAVAAAGLLLSATALGWNGILLGETARLAPEGRIGAVTGGVLSFAQLGAMLVPLLYSAVLALSGGHGPAFCAISVPALLVGLGYLWPSRPAPEPA